MLAAHTYSSPGAPFSSSKGFTLIEILLSVMVLSVVSSLTLAGFSSISQTQLLREGSTELKSTLRLIQNQAANSVKPAECASQSVLDYSIIFDTAITYYPITITCTSTTKTLSQHNLGRNLRIRAIYVNGAQHTTMVAKFLPSGRVDFYDGTGIKIPTVTETYLELVYGDGTEVYKVYMLPSGSIYDTK